MLQFTVVSHLLTCIGTISTLWTASIHLTSLQNCLSDYFFSYYPRLVASKYVMFVPLPVLNKPSTFQYAVFACRRHICVMPWLTNVEKMT
ncbi:hypothetical protein OUZ56_014314 [Daphnia magna]|uniref:Secreted protein n=1 Tax=Daphnia magna TaxID=35525 RepID=A0ABR0AJK4_9CRUS|nr:hypothetical protein OUZ56_014314 [Daphnia magna]